MTVREIVLLMTLLAISVAGVALFWMSKTRSRRGRASLRFFAIILILISAFLSFHWWAKTGLRMPAPVFTVESPGGQFIARVVEPDGDVLPTNLVRISVRRKGSFFAQQVYVGSYEPNLQWIDDTTLQLTFPATDQPATCGGSGSEPKIICKRVLAADFKSHMRI